MHPILFKIGNFPIYSYGTMLFLAFSIGMFLTLREAAREGFNIEYFYEGFIITIVLAVLGSRLAFVIINWELYSGDSIWRIFAFREGGLIFFGGFFAVLIGVFFYCRYRQVPIFKVLDLASPFIAFGYAITRLGCFLNGCCYGKITALPWGMVFPAVDEFKRHPTQLYASAAALLIFVILHHFKKHKKFDGFLFLLFIIFYTVYRFLVEFYRVSEPIFGFMTQAQLISLLLFFVASGIFFWKKRRYKGKIRSNQL